MENHNSVFFSPLEPHGSNTRFRLSPLLQPRTLLRVCGPLLYVCGHCLAVCCACATCACVRVCCVCATCACALRVRVCVCAGLCVCVLERHISGFSFLFCMLLLYYVRIAPFLKLSSSLLCGGHGTTAVAHRALPFCGGFGRRICVYVCLPCFTHTIKRDARMQRRGQGDTNPHLLPRDFKSNCAATATISVQQHHRFKLWPL